MIEIIKPGKYHKVECETCDAVLKYCSDDVQHHTGYYADVESFYAFITCPCCGNRIKIIIK